MGSLKLEQRQKVESDQEKGREIKETGEQKLEEAEASQGAMEQIEAIGEVSADERKKVRNQQVCPV